MNPEWKEKWVQALRDGSYEQGGERLRKGDTFCCLGVLVDLVDPEGWTHDDLGYMHGDNRNYLPHKVVREAGLIEGNPLVEFAGMGETTLAALNDMHGYSFEQIANVIERCL